MKRLRRGARLQGCQNRSFSEHELCEGDVGAVVHAYSDGKAFEVEFNTADGQT